MWQGPAVQGQQYRLLFLSEDPDLARCRLCSIHLPSAIPVVMVMTINPYLGCRMPVKDLGVLDYRINKELSYPVCPFEVRVTASSTLRLHSMQ